MTPFADYAAMPGLSHSAMKDLGISPLRFWSRWLDPNRVKIEPTAEMQFGSALHCALLEPDEFDRRYACMLDETKIDGLLVTMDDLRERVRSLGLRPTGTRKADLIAQVLSLNPNAPIWDVLLEEHERKHAGKVLFKVEDWLRICGAATALSNEPRVSQLLKGARTEVALTAADPETGVLLKARLDAIAATGETVDLKTFTVQRGKTVDRAVTDAIWYEGYLRQAYLYTMIRALQAPESMRDRMNRPDFVLIFCESDAPHETRIRVLRGKTGGNANTYWITARHQVRSLINLYADCMERFGVERPWRDACEVVPLDDAEIPQLGWS